MIYQGLELKLPQPPRIAAEEAGELRVWGSSEGAGGCGTGGTSG